MIVSFYDAATGESLMEVDTAQHQTAFPIPRVGDYVCHKGCRRRAQAVSWTFDSSGTTVIAVDVILRDLRKDEEEG